MCATAGGCGPSERHEERYAILNDIGHEFRTLHYYVTRDNQERQLREHGFELAECLDLEGEAVRARGGGRAQLGAALRGAPLGSG